jgi:hypothetical protein
MYKQYLAPGENVIILPYNLNGDSMLWQAQANMYFNMVQGWTGFPLTPAQFENWPIVQAMNDNIGLPDADLQLKAFLANYGVRMIIVANDSSTWRYHFDDLTPGAFTRASVSSDDRELWHSWMATLGIKPEEAGDVLIYRIDPDLLAAYKQLDAMQLTLTDAEYRFSEVLTAAAQYVQAGYDPAKLSPVRAMKLHLLPAELISRDFMSRNSERSPMQTHLLLARDDRGYIATGVVAPYSILQQLVKKFGADANRIRYLSMEPPYDLVEKSAGGAQLMLIMSFDRANLLKEAARLGATAGRATAIPLHDRSDFRPTEVHPRDLGSR